MVVAEGITHKNKRREKRKGDGLPYLIMKVEGREWLALLSRGQDKVAHSQLYWRRVKVKCKVGITRGRDEGRN